MDPELFRPHDPEIYRRARERRRDPTPAESILWSRLRDRRLGGFKFRREQPLDHYIADFFCPQARLVIELDGDSHMGKEERDARRQRYIEAQDITVIRVWNFELYDDLDTVLEAIWAALQRAGVGPQPSPRARGGGRRPVETQGDVPSPGPQSRAALSRKGRGETPDPSPLAARRDRGPIPT